MFKYLSSRGQDPGFPNAVILTNKSEHWLEVDDQGRRIPPKSHAAMSAEMVAVSEQISAHVSAGLLLVSGGQDSSQQGKTKRRKKHEDAEVQKLIEQPSEPQPSEPEHSDNQLPPEPESDDVINLVAEPEHENWVSSTENIVGLPTTDEI